MNDRRVLRSPPDELALSARPPSIGRAGFVAFVSLTVLAVCGRAQDHHLGAPAPGLLETGAPQFNIREHEAIGLDSPPTDLRLLPDGRILAFAPHQIALGDGLRWEVFQQSPSDPTTTGNMVVVDRTGQIYVGVPGGVGRVEFGDNAQWRVTGLTNLETENRPMPPILTSVVPVGDAWFWHGETGPLIEWEPEKAPRVLGRTDTIEQVFRLGPDVFLSDRTNGRVWRAGPVGLEAVDYLPSIAASSTPTCAVPFDAGRLLIGTYTEGLMLFDGKTARPFATQAGLGEGFRINDLCVTEDGSFAAAVESVGMVFFDHTGRTLQVVDRTVDHRLANVQRLVSAPGGVILGLLSDGVLQVGFPSPVSHFEPLVGTGVTTAHPYRLQGRLWLMADGHIHRAIYDEHGRLVRFQVDSPPGRFAFAFSCDLGVPLTGTDRGAFYRDERGWVSFAPDTVNFRILSPHPVDGRWIYGATNEVGWIHRRGGTMELERIAMPGLDNLYNTETDADGAIWIEQGDARVARLRMGGPHGATLEQFGQRDGIPGGWAQVFTLNGKVRFNCAGVILRFDEAARKFVRDDELLRGFPPLTAITGRPGNDAQGRAWITANGGVEVLAPTADGRWRSLNLPMPSGFAPYYFAFEDDGVVWMHRDRRFARFDPAMPIVRPQPLTALITFVTLPGSGRTLFSAGKELPPLQYDDNSLVVHFLAPGTPPGVAVNFEVKLEGADTQWVSTGAIGSAVFSRLKEGRYMLRVRPVAASRIGAETTLALTIQPPWFRTPLAYLVYGASVIGLIIAIGRIQTILQRRENARLERLVALRTRELAASHEQLSTRMEEIRLLSQAIEQSPVGVMMIRPDGTIAFANPRACEMFGYALPELIGRAADQLHDPETSAAALAEMAGRLARGEPWHGQLTKRRQDGARLRLRSLVVPVRHADGTLRHRLVLDEDITDWMAEQERRRRLEAQLFQAQKVESLGTLAGGIAHDFNNILTGMLGYCELATLSADGNAVVLSELEGLRNAGLRARDLVKQILTFARQSSAKLEPLDLAVPVDSALKLFRASAPATVEIVSTLRHGAVRADATQIQQLVLNLCTNALHALPQRTGRIEITLDAVDVTENLAAELPHFAPGAALRLVVSDNGCGMEAATLDRIFDPFFTTKPLGEGTGLGLAVVHSILTAHGAARRVRSLPGVGTTFELFFPLTGGEPISPTVAMALPRGDAEEVLVVDDERFVAEFAAKRLRQIGYRPTVHTDARAALAAVEAAPRRFHAIVTDLTMPYLTGADLVERIRALNPDMPAVIITGYGREAVRAQVQALPRCLVLPKPFTGEELAVALKKVLGAML